MIVKQASDANQRKAFLQGLDTDAISAVEGADAIIYKSSWIPFYSIAEKLGVPSAAAMFMPLTRTSSFPSFLIGGGKDRGTTINSLFGESRNNSSGRYRGILTTRCAVSSWAFHDCHCWDLPHANWNARRSSMPTAQP